jgi:hypothetical protein
MLGYPISDDAVVGRAEVSFCAVDPLIPFGISAAASAREVGDAGGNG